MADNVRMRKDVWRLSHDSSADNGWHPDLVWYARAVAEMQSRPITDPTSWRYQAAIHDYVADADPLASPADGQLSDEEQRRFWRQCQHASWFFLPWHRMYLACFEQILLSIIVDLGGPSDWALPYWNYSDEDNPDARKLPPAFRNATLPNDDGTTRPNPLLVAARAPDANTGEVDIATDLDVDLRCLDQPRFPAASQQPGSPGFGGPIRLNHRPRRGDVVGALETTPHGDMHVAVGGDGSVGGVIGWMSRFHTAALDPIFWLHHANIDRLWVVWRGDETHLDPDDSGWPTQRFEFHTADGEVVLTPADVVDTTLPPLRYQYEDVRNPRPGVRDAVGGARRAAVEREPIPEVVGATESGVTLTGQPTTVRLSLSAPTGPARARARSGRPPRVYMNFENITGQTPTSYAVYLNLPDGADPRQHRELVAGTLPMFGVDEASRDDDDHPGNGLHYALEISGVIRALQARNDWDPNDFRVVLVPVSVLRGAAGAPARTRRAVARDPIHVGRISVAHE